MSQKPNAGGMTIYSRVPEELFKFLESMAKKHTWGKFAKIIIFCIAFSKENEEEFNKFVEKLRWAI